MASLFVFFAVFVVFIVFVVSIDLPTFAHEKPMRCATDYYVT